MTKWTAADLLSWITGFNTELNPFCFQANQCQRWVTLYNALAWYTCTYSSWGGGECQCFMCWADVAMGQFSVTEPSVTHDRTDPVTKHNQWLSYWLLVRLAKPLQISARRRGGEGKGGKRRGTHALNPNYFRVPHTGTTTVVRNVYFY